MVAGFFISNVERSFPNLRVLSMMNNEAAPSYFNDKTYMEHVDYRSANKHYVTIDFIIITNHKHSKSVSIILFQ